MTEQPMALFPERPTWAFRWLWAREPMRTIFEDGWRMQYKFFRGVMWVVSWEKATPFSTISQPRCVEPDSLRISERQGL